MSSLKTDEPRAYMKYVGACALLGRLSTIYSFDESDIDSICRCLNDCVEESDGSLTVSVAGRGYSLDVR